MHGGLHSKKKAFKIVNACEALRRAYIVQIGACKLVEMHIGACVLDVCTFI